jgi:hypothetical protein
MIISTSERVLFVGATGSGKTELAKRLLKDVQRVLVIDPKHTFTLDNFKLRKSLKIYFWERKEFRFIVRPQRGDDNKLRDLLEGVFAQGDLTIYVDELASLADRFPLTLETLEDIARTGRERRVSLWNAVQRPRGTPKIFMTETETFFIYNLRAEADRQHMAGFVGEKVAEARLPEHEFLYCRADANSIPLRMKLNIRTGDIIRLGEEK